MKLPCTILLLLSSCSFFSPASSITSCLNVSGKYEVVPYDLNHSDKLSSRVMPRVFEFLWGVSSNGRVDKLIVEQSGCTALKIRPYTNNLPLTELTFELKQANQSSLLIRDEEKSYTNEIALNVDKHTKDFLRLNSNGDLILERQSSTFTFIFFIPFWGSEDYEIGLRRVR